MNDKRFQSLKTLFKSQPAVKLVYLFGSQAKKNAGPLSDYDFGLFLDEKDPRKRTKLKLELISKISGCLKTDAVDLVILNDPVSPELKFAIIKEGELIYAEEPWEMLAEPRILNEYFDFRQSLLRYGLTKAV